MMVRNPRPILSILACASLCSAAAAQPKLIITGIAGDLARSGDRAVGLVNVGLTGANSNYSTLPIAWRRGVGYTIIPGAEYQGGGDVSCSSDLTALSVCAENTSNWGDLNCFRGYCFGSMTGCTPGEPRPPLTPCEIPGITHHWTMASGWVNAGSFTRTQDIATGRFYGGTRCDYTINTPNDISGDGRFIVGGSYWAPLTTESGGPGFGMCGDFYGFRYDSLTGQFTQLPSTSTTARADRVNNDGSVITGYDLIEVPVDNDGDGNPDGTDSWRRTVAWRDGVEHIIDPYRGAKDSAGISGPGTFVASGASTQYVAETFPGQNGVRLVRWTWNGSAWVPTNLGRPADFPDPSSGVGIPFGDLWVSGISDDGNTIVGMAQYGPPPPTLGGLRRPYIWRPTINGGVPIDLEIYLRSLDPANPIFSSLFEMQYAQGVSGDGNQVLVTILDRRNTCPIGFNAPRSLVTFNAGIVYLDGASEACEAPRIGVGPEDWDDTGGLSQYGVSLNVVASGTWPLTYQWQREDPNAAGTWINLTESCQGFTTQADWDYEGVHKNQIRIGIGNDYASRAGRYRVVISNSCGTATSEPAMVTFSPGACCLAGGACQIEFFYNCVSTLTLSGEWQGGGTACTPTVCGPRACCIAEVCALVDPLTCEANEGTAGAEGSTCTPDPCSTSTGACCCGSSCSITISAECTGSNKSFAGAATTCTPYSASVPCCRGDFNKTGAPATVQDIFDFLSAYFGGDSCADSNDSGGANSVQDIFDFLGAYFGGC